MTTHLFSYRYKGAEYSMEVEGENEADARNRHYAMAHASYDGKLVAKIPAVTGAGLGVRIVTFLRNLVKS